MTETVDANALDIGEHFKHPESDEWYVVIDGTRAGEYGPWVWACGDPETGDYEGLLTTNPNGGPMIERAEPGEEWG